MRTRPNHARNGDIASPFQSPRLVAAVTRSFGGGHRVRPKKLAVIFAAAFCASIVTFPPISRWGGLAEFTFAIASQDMPSGFYYDRDFDWPTGEVSVLIDVPVWPLHLLLFCCTAISLLARYHGRLNSEPASGANTH